MQLIFQSDSSVEIFVSKNGNHLSLNPLPQISRHYDLSAESTGSFRVFASNPWTQNAAE